jgi:hypothetical protein
VLQESVEGGHCGFFQLTVIACLSAYVIFLSDNSNEEQRRRGFIKIFGQALAKPAIVCQLVEKFLKTKFLKIL